MLINKYILSTFTFVGIIFSQILMAANTHTYIIEFENPALLEYDGGIEGLSATKPSRNGNKKPNFDSIEVQQYLALLEQQQDTQLVALKSALGRNVNYMMQYKVATNGAAIELYQHEVSIVANLPGIKSIEADVQYELDTDAGPQFIGADTIWDGSNAPLNTPNKGEGIVIAVLDTGINSDHTSYSDTPEDGYDFAAANPLGAGNFLGDCAGAFPTITCNNKLIGAYDFTNDAINGAPEDDAGHGSHTASTVAGNALSAPIGGFIDTETGNVLDAPSISGVAPHAHIIAYDVCIETCPGAAIIGAIDQAITDGVDVISFSISGGSNPWSDNDRRFLNALGAGIVISTSAGNTSTGVPNPVAAVNHRGPWLLSVANSTHNRANSNDVNIKGPGTVPGFLMDIYGLLGVINNFSGPILDMDVIYAGDVDINNITGCAAWTGTPFINSVALIRRGGCNFSVKIDFAETAGAEAVIVFNDERGPIPIVMGGIETTNIPAIMIGSTDGDNIVDFIANAVTQATIDVMDTPIYRILDEIGNVLNTSSLRGPNLTFDVTKPDINGPGTNIFAAYADGLGTAPQLTFLSGTSMSAPHVSGAAALVIATNPTWTPSEVISALMMTANNTDPLKDNALDPADADDIGSGTVDLTKAALSGLVLDETYDNFLAANPSNGGDPRTLNLASMRNSSCTPNCSWTRTLRFTQDIATTWEIIAVTDGTFTLEVSPTIIQSNDVIFHDIFEQPFVPPGIRTIDEFTITVTASGVPDVNDGMAFGEIQLIEQNDEAPAVHLSVTVNQNNPPL